MHLPTLALFLAPQLATLAAAAPTQALGGGASSSSPSSSGPDASDQRGFGSQAAAGASSDGGGSSRVANDDVGPLPGSRSGTPPPPPPHGRTEVTADDHPLVRTDRLFCTYTDTGMGGGEGGRYSYTVKVGRLSAGEAEGFKAYMALEALSGCRVTQWRASGTAGDGYLWHFVFDADAACSPDRMPDVVNGALGGHTGGPGLDKCVAKAS